MYTKIYNPLTKKFVNIQSKLGRSILNSYIYMSGGSSPTADGPPKTRYNKYKYTPEDKNWRIEGGKTGSKFNRTEKNMCERHSANIFTKGKNKEYPGCENGWCCSLIKSEQGSLIESEESSLKSSPRRQSNLNPLKKLYIEEQIALWCGAHSMNNVLQDNLVSAKYSIDNDMYVDNKLNLFKVCKSLWENTNETNFSERRITTQERCKACDYLIGISITDNKNEFRGDGTNRATSVQKQHKLLNMTWKDVVVYDTVKQHFLKEFGIDALDIPIGSWKKTNTYEFFMNPTESKLTKINWLKDIECLKDVLNNDILKRVVRIKDEILKPHTTLLCPIFAGQSPVDNKLQKHITSEVEEIDINRLIQEGSCDVSGNFSIDVIEKAYILLGYYTQQEWRRHHLTDESYVQKLQDYSKDSKFIGVSINVPGHWVAITKTTHCPDFTYLDSVGKRVKCGDIKTLFNTYASRSEGYISVFQK